MSASRMVYEHVCRGGITLGVRYTEGRTDPWSIWGVEGASGHSYMQAPEALRGLIHKMKMRDLAPGDVAEVEAEEQAATLLREALDRGFDFSVLGSEHLVVVQQGEVFVAAASTSGRNVEPLRVQVYARLSFEVGVTIDQAERWVPVEITPALG